MSFLVLISENQRQLLAKSVDLVIAGASNDSSELVYLYASLYDLPADELDDPGRVHDLTVV